MSNQRHILRPVRASKNTKQIEPIPGRPCYFSDKLLDYLITDDSPDPTDAVYVCEKLPNGQFNVKKNSTSNSNGKGKAKHNGWPTT